MKRRGLRRGRAGPALLPYWVLLHVGLALPPAVTGGAVRFYRTFSPLLRLAAGRYVFCGAVRRTAFETALLAVSQHTALRSPDFPPPAEAGSNCPPRANPKLYYRSPPGRPLIDAARGV